MTTPGITPEERAAIREPLRVSNNYVDDYYTCYICMGTGDSPARLDHEEGCWYLRSTRLLDALEAAERGHKTTGVVLDDLLERLARDGYCELCGDLYPDEQYSTGEHEDGCAIAVALRARYAAPDAEGASDE